MASKLTWHFQSIPGWANGLMNGDWVKVIDPPSTNPFPCAKVIGRVYIPDNEANAMIMCGAAGAADYFNRCKPAYDRAGYVYAWEGPNEPPVQTAQQRAMLCEFTQTWTFLMHNQAPLRHVVVWCLSVGWPDIGQAPELAGALKDADYMALHEYSAPTMQSNQTWLCLRYRRTMDELRKAGVHPIPPLLITECGIDGGVAGKPGKGWKTYTDRAGYMSQLAWYDGELQKDSYVRAATIFTSGPNYNWQDFDMDEELSKALHAYNACTPTQPEEPTVTPTIIMPEPRLIMPLKGQVKPTQGFGEHAVDYSKFGLIGHNGLDLWAAGTPEILATHPGQCWVYDDPEGYGLTIEVWYPSIDHAEFKTIYAHMSKQIAQHKQLVMPGTTLGLMGSTGSSTGPHLHFGLKFLKGVNPGYRNWVDPTPFMW